MVFRGFRGEGTHVDREPRQISNHMAEQYLIVEPKMTGNMDYREIHMAGHYLIVESTRGS